MHRRRFIRSGLCAVALSAFYADMYAGDRRGKTMVLPNAQAPPFNSALMGLIRGVADCYGIAISDAMLYGGSRR